MSGAVALSFPDDDHAVWSRQRAPRPSHQHDSWHHDMRRAVGHFVANFQSAVRALPSKASNDLVRNLPKDTGLGNAAMERDGVKRAREDLKSSVDNLTREPGAAISVTTGGITTTLKNVDGKRVLEQTGEPPHDMGPPPRDPGVNSAIDFLKRDMNRAAAQ